MRTLADRNTMLVEERENVEKKYSREYQLIKDSNTSLLTQ